MTNTNHSDKQKSKFRPIFNYLIRWLIPTIILGGIYIYQTPRITDRMTKFTQELELDHLTKKFTLRNISEYAVPIPGPTTTTKPNGDKTTDSIEGQTQKPQADNHLNVALNKPVVELPLNIQRIDSIDRNKKRDIVGLQFDQGRLMSHVLYYEQYSVNKETYPSNLTDGDHSTAAYPADFVFDYIVDLRKRYKLSEIRLQWGGYGTPAGDNNYITGWELYGQESFSAKDFPSMNDWVLIKQGGIPGTAMTRVSDKFLKKPVQRLRIKARSEATGNRRANWIGMYELEAYGTLLK